MIIDIESCAVCPLNMRNEEALGQCNHPIVQDVLLTGGGTDKPHEKCPLRDKMLTLNVVKERKR